MKKIQLLIVLLALSFFASAQEMPKLKISGYLETYYTYDFNQPADHNRPSFIYSHNRTNEVNLNLGFIKAAYENGNIRGNLAFMAGTYTNANLAAEPGVLKNVLEANIGVKLSKTANLWIDAGIFSSHIGFESAVSKDCWVLTRNISSENTPYYESGAKLSYSTNDGKLTATALYLNGWQRITRQNGNNAPAGGLQLTYKPTASFTLNYSNYIGVEGADSVRVRRIYHNIYGVFQLNKRVGLTLGFDYGSQQKQKGRNETSKVLSPVAIVQYKFAEQWALAGRFEYYEDKDAIFVATNKVNGFKTSGYSLNIDYSPVTNAVIRLEGKTFNSKDQTFIRQGSLVSSNTSLTASIAVSF